MPEMMKKHDDNPEKTIAPDDASSSLDEGADLPNKKDPPEPLEINNDYLFRKLFKGGNLSLKLIKDMFKYPQDKFERVISICLALTIFFALNPVMPLAYYFAGGSIIYLIFFIGLVVSAGALISFKKGEFPFFIIAAAIILKIFVFNAAISDAYLSVAMFILSYLLFRTRRQSP